MCRDKIVTDRTPYNFPVGQRADYISFTFRFVDRHQWFAFYLANCFTRTFLPTPLRQHDTFVALQKVEINFGREKHRNLHRHVSYFVTSAFPSTITQVFVWMLSLS